MSELNRSKALLFVIVQCELLYNLHVLTVRSGLMRRSLLRFHLVILQTEIIKKYFILRLELNSMLELNTGIKSL